MSEVPAAETLGHVRRFSLGASLVVYPALVVEAGTVDHQRVTFPLANRVAHVSGLRGCGERTTIQQNLAVVIVRLVKNGDDHRGLEDLPGDGQGIEVCHAVREAALGWMAFRQIFCALLGES